MKHQTSNEIAIFRAPFLRCLLVLKIELSKLLFSLFRDLNRQLPPTVNLVKCFTTNIYQPLIQWICAKHCERLNERKLSNCQISQQQDKNN